MSWENVQLAQRVFECFNRRDAPGLLDLTDPDCEWVTSITAVDATTFRGASGISQFFAELAETWEELTVTLEEFREFGDRVLVTGRQHGRGRGSGARIDQPAWWLMEMRDGKLVRSELFREHAQALEAVGLRR